ncbi:hypothetical protein PFICI_13237 [Pestalotiopsis fici W106-1]|uniref:Vacuolar sorting protein Vps3844 C-terminal domain-containing protein n=1 Tax=Pestalotiopsis fici (strain W106-1 / CGMCC3.15140) TaxID=1229662 RepID=W3WLN2_PESFW|nr:uncharacterized protein PFICI_13237 [Pestalotiopsis fici W106-1]ETS74753.1 hypothetical protein PFICI_13237 [Pestalotiopsis fici W106-1]
MKLWGFLVPALAGLAAAAESEIEAYILRSQQAGSASSISSSAAQTILQQRVGYAKQLPEDISEEDIHQIAQYGIKSSQHLFSDAPADDLSSLVVVIKNADDAHVAGLKKAISSYGPSFTAPGLDKLPSSYLPKVSKQCSLEDTIALKSGCWRGKSAYLEYDAAKDSKALKSLASSIGKLQGNTLETVVVTVPTSSTPSELRRRQQSEAVLNKEFKIQTTSSESESAATKNDDQSFNPHPFVAKVGAIPACFTSKNSCETATANCSGHGICLNKFKSDADSSCYACHCQKTREKKGSDSIWYWGGAACQKQDVSVPFWMFVGFTIFMVGAVAFSISLLFNVGEEKLPGVIGAGVSRGSK